MGCPKLFLFLVVEHVSGLKDLEDVCLYPTTYLYYMSHVYNNNK